MHQDPDRDRYTSDEEDTVIDNAADELELTAVSKLPTRLLPHVYHSPGSTYRRKIKLSYKTTGQRLN